MLPIQVKKLLVKSMPSTVIIDGNTFELQKTFGNAALNTIISPTVNLSIVTEDKIYYQSIDDNYHQIDNTITEYDIRTAILQYKIGAFDKKLTSNEVITKTNLSNYSLTNTPVLNINSVGSFVKNVDYRLLNDHETISWLKSGPAINSEFTVNYDWIENGYWIAYSIADYIMQYIFTDLRPLLASYDVSILKVRNVVDLSAIYTDEAFNACSFDVQLTYPYSRTRALSEEDGVTLESIALDLIVNGHDAGTIHVPDV